MTESFDILEQLGKGTIITLSMKFQALASFGDEKVTFEYAAGSCAHVFCANVEGRLIKDILIGNGTFKTPFITANPENSGLAEIAAKSIAEATGTSTYAISRSRGNFEELKIYR